jgi:glycine/D-amino acid oxidase-like deaminating enzyme
LGDLTDITNLEVAKDTVVLLNAVSSPAIDDASYGAIRQALQKYDVKYEDVDPASLDFIDPDPLGRPLSAMRLMGEGAVNSERLLTALEKAHERVGGIAVDGEVISLLTEGGRVRGVMLSSGQKVAGDRVVLAGGVRAQTLLDQLPDLAVRIPRLVCGLGVSCVVRPPAAATPDVVIRTPNRSFACGLHLVPRANGTVYLGATNTIHFTPHAEPHVDDVTFLLNCAVNQVDRSLQSASIVRLQVGNRPVSIDGFPLIGETSLDGLWLASGTYRDGLQISPLLATYIADRLNGKQPGGALEAFSPEREPLQAGTRDQIAADAATHIMASGYERSWTLPANWPPLIQDLFRERCLTFTYALSGTYTPPAEVVVALVRATDKVRDDYRQYYRRVREAWRAA